MSYTVKVQVLIIMMFYEKQIRNENGMKEKYRVTLLQMS